MKEQQAYKTDILRQSKIFSTEKTQDQAQLLRSQPLTGEAELEIQPDLDDFDIEARPNRVSKNAKWLWLIGLSTFFALVLIETVISILAAWQSHFVLGALYTLLFLVIFILGTGFIIRELKLLYKLKRAEREQKQAHRLLNSEQIGEARYWIETLNDRVAKSRAQIKNNKKANALLKQSFDQFEKGLTDFHTDKEVMLLYSDIVLAATDKQVKHQIDKYAIETALLVAISPLAVTDMLAILVRSSQMVDRISQMYGMPLGYISRIKLYRTLLKAMLFAGVSELLTDLVSSTLGAELAGKLSMRFGQGLGAGVFTARLGYKTMQICRPIPHQEQNKRLFKNSCAQLHNLILSQLSKDRSNSSTS